jgi:cysteine desulfurase/selenocysteine lyase
MTTALDPKAMDLDLESERWRSEFPFLQAATPNRPVAFLDSAASSQKPLSVLERMDAFAKSEYANVHRGIYDLSERATLAYESARERVARFLNAGESRCVVFTRGTTEAVNLTAYSWGEANLRAGDTLLLTEMEHHSNLLPWQQLATRKAATLEFVPVLPNGAGLDVSMAETMLARGPRLFAFAHVPNTLGLVNPVSHLCERARHHGVTTFIDGAQSAGHMPVDLEEIGCDFFACSSHKMCGPTGIGVLCAHRKWLDAMPPWQFGGEMVEKAGYTAATFRSPPSRFEAGTPPIIEAAGLAAAIDFLERIGLEKIAAHSVALASQAEARLRALPDVRVLGPEGRQSGIVTFAVEGVHAHDVAFFANGEGVAMRAGHHCAQPLMNRLGLSATTRASFYLYNTETDVDRLMDAVEGAIRFFRP